jgi:hypothetical protein
MTKRLADSTRPVMTNSSLMAEYVRRAYGSQRVYIVHSQLTLRSYRQ